jgi:hypothetical protein
MPMITEPTLEHYIYYLRQVEGDNTKAIQEHRTAFEEELRSLLAHLECLSGQTTPAWEWPQESQDRHVSQRIVRTDWLDNPETGRSCFVEARTYGDVYWLQVGYCKSGQAGPEIFASLRDEAWEPLATDHLLGSSSYLCGIAADEVDELAAQAIAAYTDDTPGTILPTHLADCCAGLYGSPRRPYVTVLFYPHEECEDWAGRTILNDVALRLELYKHKADRQLAWCEGALPLLSEQERSLRDLLDEVKRTSPTDPKLLRRLILPHWVFESNLGMLAERQTTVEINLENLDTVIEDLGPVAGDRFLGSVRDRLLQRQRQLEADLSFADQFRRQADAAINAFKVLLGLDRLIELRAEPGDAVLIERAGWPGAPPPVEAEIDALTPRQKPSQPVTHPQINAPPHIPLTVQDKALLRHVYRGFGQVLVEKEFGGGYGGARVLLALPVTTGDLPAARRVTKLGPASGLRRERDNYEQYVEDFLPFSAARVERERYYEQDGQAGLNYVFVGGGAMGQTMDLEEYYHQAASSGDAEPITRTLNDLLDKELGQIWYGKSTPLPCFFAAEYGQHMVEHLRLKLRPASADALWPVGHSPAAVVGYRRIEVDAIPREHEAIQPGTLLSVEGMVVRKVKRGEVKLQDHGGQGIVVRVEFAPESDAIQGLELRSRVGVRGELVYNRHDRMEQIVRAAFPALSPGGGGECIELPGVPETYPNPLTVYPQVLGRVLEGRRSYVHGDLHLRNVLVDKWGRGWLIDFARVEKRHNLFDFIKLETYVRLMGLAGDEITFSHDEYAQFEKALADATLGKESGATCPANSHLETAYQVILAIRHIARSYMMQKPDAFLAEYFPALFLYCLAVIKHHQNGKPQPTRLAFATTCVLGKHIRGLDEQSRQPSLGQKDTIRSVKVADAQSKMESEDMAPAEKTKGGGALSSSPPAASKQMQKDQVSGTKIEIDNRSGIHFEGQAPVYIGGDVVGRDQTKVSYETHFHTDSPHISADASLETLLAALYQAVATQSPLALRSEASQRVDMLARAVVESEPDPGLMESVLSWFQRHLSSLAGEVVAIILHPTVVQMVKAAGTPTVAEFQRRFGGSRE